jgi:hypothetical protein
METFDFIAPMIRRALDQVETRLGADFGTESGLQIAEELFLQSLVYIAASVDVDERERLTPQQLARLLSYIADGLKSSIATLRRGRVEVKIVVIENGRDLAGVITKAAEARGVN